MNPVNPSRSIRSRKTLLAATALIAWILTGLAGASAALSETLDGVVTGLNGPGLAGYDVSLYVSLLGGQGGKWSRLAVAVTDTTGAFQLNYSLPSKLTYGRRPILFVEAERGPVLLASAIGEPSDAPDHVVVNERTTIATGNAFAQFIHGHEITGNLYGMINAIAMAANLADPATGEVGQILASSPNGTETSTLETFNSLTNVVASCVANEANCAALFDATTPKGRSRPTNVLQAVANIVEYPSYPNYPTNASDPLFLLSQIDPVYAPALAARPTNWLLFLKITGGFYSAQDSDNLMDGPGNFAIDGQGFVWVNDNYIPRPPDDFTCAGRRLIEFDPSGKNIPGSPYFGGGLNGAGYGITLDPDGNVWVGNFGFQDPPCPFPPFNDPATQNSVSVFAPDGTALSPADGLTQGGISWPQATVSDRDGNIWTANCGNDSVTKIPGGNPIHAFNIPLGPPPTPGYPQMKPFGAVVDLQGNLWVADNRSDTVSVVSSDGTQVTTLPGTYNGKMVLTHPMGDAADSKGNVWIANSDWVDVPCPPAVGHYGTAQNPSITMYRMTTRTPYPGSPFTGGGLTLPWGIAVDGDNTVWVFNFGVVAPILKPPYTYPDRPPTGISRFCGVDTGKCPPGMSVGDPISPATGYRSNAIERITGGQIDPSGNIWMVNNWKRDVVPERNPGANAVVIAIGAAAPIKTPLIGPPVPFQPLIKPPVPPPL